MSKTEDLPGDHWANLSTWWLDEVADPAYDGAVTPVLVEILRGVAGGGVVADLGAGDGRLVPIVEEMTESRIVALELVEDLAQLAGFPVVLSRLPITPFAAASLAGAYAVLVLDHVQDHAAFFGETARIVRPGGFLAVVSNHPMWTAPGSTPIGDHDGEILWRAGNYFEPGASSEPAGDGEVVFYHRSTSEILNTAALAGWELRYMVERPHHDEGADAGVPRLVGFRWARRREPA